MVVAHSALATSSSSGALGSCVEASLGRSVGASMDNECRSDLFFQMVIWVKLLSAIL
jgi:hypothetical protein